MITAAQISIINNSYVERQLDKIDITARQSVKITAANGLETHFIGLNDRDTISLLINYLLKRKEVIK